MPAHLSSRPSGAQLAVHAWKSAAAASARMPVLMLSVLAASLVLGLASYYLTLALPAGMNHLPGSFARGFVLVVLKAAVVAPLAVAMHRFILLDDVTPRLRYAPRHTWLFFCWTLALQLAGLLLGTAGAIATAKSGAILIFVALYGGTFAKVLMFLLLFSVILVLWIASVYLAMIFPAVATDVPSAGPLARIATSMRQMRGHFWQFIGAAVVSLVPLLVPFMILTLWLQRVMLRDAVLHGMTHDALLSGPAGNWFLAICLIGGVETVAVVAVAAAVASWTYAALDLKD